MSPWDNKSKSANRSSAFAGFTSNSNQYRSVFDKTDNEVASIVSSLSGVSNHTFGAANSTNLFNGNKGLNDNASDADNDIFGNYKRGALSAISTPMALGKNNSRLQSNVFGAASISGGIPTTVGSSNSGNFLDKFSSVAEATKEVEHLATFGRLSLNGKRNSFSSRRASFLNEETRTSPLLDKISSPNSIHESLNGGGAYRSTLSERIDSMYKSPNQSNTKLGTSEYSNSEKSSVSLQLNSNNSNSSNNVNINNSNAANINAPSNLNSGTDAQNAQNFHTSWNPASAASFTPMFNSQVNQQPPMFPPQGPYGPFGFPINQYPMSMMPPPPPGSAPNLEQHQQPPFIPQHQQPAGIMSSNAPQSDVNGEITPTSADDPNKTFQPPNGMLNNGVPMGFPGFGPYPMFSQGPYSPQPPQGQQIPLSGNVPPSQPGPGPAPIGVPPNGSLSPKDAVSFKGVGSPLSGSRNASTSPVPGNGHFNNHKKNHRKISHSPPASNPRRKPHIYRSPLLEQFRNNKTNKKYTLTDIFEHAVEFSKDQHGSRFIQQEIEHATTEEKEVFFNQIREVSFELMTDVFGNYVIQKFFEHGTDIQIGVLFENMKGKIYELSLQMYGCRVVQRALEKISLEQRLSVVEELKDHILICVKDQNANHVIQKAIEKIPFEKISFILVSLKDQIYHLSTNPYGCRVIQRLLENGSKADQKVILGELSRYIFYLIQDQYGNYVIQHILENGSDEERQKISKIVKENVVNFSKHKFASNVVEKAVYFGSEQERKDILSAVLKDNDKDDGSLVGDSTPLALMMKDQFANYVVQKLLEISRGDQKTILIKKIKQYLSQISSANSYGKHLASIEKLIALSETASKELDLN